MIHFPAQRSRFLRAAINVPARDTAVNISRVGRKIFARPVTSSIIKSRPPFQLFFIGTRARRLLRRDQLLVPRRQNDRALR